LKSSVAESHVSIMPDAPNHPNLREYRVVCRGERHTAYILPRSAPDPESAMQSAREAGHEPLICLPVGLMREEESSIVRAWRLGMKVCPGCGYSLAGLLQRPCLTCPECGLGTVSRPPEGPFCGKCGYNMAGLSIGIGPVHCPECGSRSLFRKR
jgi:hypothetical protein